MEKRGKAQRRKKKLEDFLMYFPYAETLLPFQPASLKHKGFKKPFRPQRTPSSSSNSSQEDPLPPSHINLASKLNPTIYPHDPDDPLPYDDNCSDLVTVAQLLSPQKPRSREVKSRGNWRSEQPDRKLRFSMTPLRTNSPVRNEHQMKYLRPPLRLPKVKRERLSVIAESITQSTPTLPGLMLQQVEGKGEISESESMTQLQVKPKTCKGKYRKKGKAGMQMQGSPRPKTNQGGERKIQTVEMRGKGMTEGQQREQMLDILLRNRTSTDHLLLMQEYVKRLGLPYDTCVFILHSQDDFIRRAFKRRGWYENKVLNSTAFHLKWTYTDSESDYRALRPGQYFNHFPNNRKLTTKNGLNSIFRLNCDYSLRPSAFYPRTYDLGDANQVDELRADYEKTAAMNVIKQHSEYFLSLENREAGVEVSLVNIFCLRTAVRYCKQVLRDDKDKCERESKYVFIADRRKVYVPAKEEWRYLMEYSKLRLPLYEITDEIKEKCSARYDYTRSWALPTTKLQSKCIKLHHQLSSSLSQYHMEGWRNVWVVKPGQNARGSGVHCSDNLEEIMDCGAGMQARIVQKYVEKPLLLKLNRGNVKFDIRQWVLVTGFEPLEVFYFNSCYLRLCTQPFKLEDLKDRFSHLANYSVQKSATRGSEDTVWSLGQFLVYLSQTHPALSWKDSLQPQLHSLILQTLKCVSDEIDPRPGCFELYGFDIILDEDLHPWLLEVNLSPACMERTPWLTSMLDAMGDGLLKVVLDAERLKPVVSLDGSHDYPPGFTVDTFEWLYLYKGQEIPTDNKDKPPFSFEITGERINLRRERQLEKRFKREQACILIQKIARGFLIRNKKFADRKQNAAIVVQKNFRVYQAKLQRKMLKLELEIAIIQRVFRRFLDENYCENARKSKIAVKIQTLQRKKKAIETVKKMKEERFALLFQCVFRQKEAKITLENEKNYRNQVKLIQKWAKKRYIEKQKSAITVQKHFRGLKERKKLAKIKNEIHEIRSIQSIFRRFLSIQTLKSVKIDRNMSLIQTIFRGFLSNLVYFEVQKAHAASIILHQYHVYQAKKAEKSLRKAKLLRHKAVMYIQAHIKGFLTRQKYEIMRRTKAAVTIQRLFRGHMARLYCRIVRKRHESAVAIQRRVRGVIARKEVEVRRKQREEEGSRVQMRKEYLAKGIAASERLANRQSPGSEVSARSAVLETSFKSVKRRLSAHSHSTKRTRESASAKRPTRDQPQVLHIQSKPRVKSTRT